MDAARLDLGEVREQGGQELVRTADEAAGGGEQLGVGESIEGVVRGETERGVHESHHNPGFFEALMDVLRHERRFTRVTKHPSE